MLSTVAGIVNVAGVLALSTLTTNVTGHFAFFAEEAGRSEYQRALTFFIYILSFLSGAFLCGLLVEWALRRNPSRSHALPLILEIILLIVVSILFTESVITRQWLAGMLLFAMGMQNALVTQVSKATVRTTHLTGLFTDLGIELAQLFFYRQRDQKGQLSQSIFLRMTIISFFFLGCVAGGFAYNLIGIYGLLIAAAILAVALVYDVMRVGISYYRRRIKLP